MSIHLYGMRNRWQTDPRVWGIRQPWAPVVLLLSQILSWATLPVHLLTRQVEEEILLH